MDAARNHDGLAAVLDQHWLISSPAVDVPPPEFTRRTTAETLPFILCLSQQVFQPFGAARRSVILDGTVHRDDGDGVRLGRLLLVGAAEQAARQQAGAAGALHHARARCHAGDDEHNYSGDDCDGDLPPVAALARRGGLRRPLRRGRERAAREPRPKAPATPAVRPRRRCRSVRCPYSATSLTDRAAAARMLELLEVRRHASLCLARRAQQELAGCSPSASGT